MADEKRELRYLTVKELFANAQPSTLMEDVRKEVEKEAMKPKTLGEILGNLANWSILSHQVVGAEYRHPYERR